ncbi:hypothetical protein Y032_1055g3508 [Ancylostoma ceylanicum]|uniref:Uncharacterized protein n=1 Tax=Ancylostoma ceylanicum TaxID=53326 RepID=A0A016W725_9BILA|nr:hypothetical protein Y032_1055g3508 [Ancylostoma ceylanicum]
MKLDFDPCLTRTYSIYFISAHHSRSDKVAQWWGCWTVRQRVEGLDPVISIPFTLLFFIPSMLLKLDLEELNIKPIIIS